MTNNYAFAERLERRIKSLPEFFQPIAYGATVIVGFMVARGALFVFPIAVIYVLVTSKTPIADLAKAAALLLIVIGAGALSGLAYSLIGRYLRRQGAVGAYLAGVVTVTPYMLVLIHISVDKLSDPLLHRADSFDYMIAAGLSVFFGTIIGYGFYRTDRKRAVLSDGAT